MKDVSLFSTIHKKSHSLHFSAIFLKSFDFQIQMSFGLQLEYFYFLRNVYCILNEQEPIIFLSSSNDF